MTQKSMKYILLIGILISFSDLNLIAQSKDDSLTVKIKMIKEVSYKVEKGKLKNREGLFTSNIDIYKVFDKNGKVIENRRYNPDGSIYEKTIYERNKKGDAIKAVKKNSSNKLKSYWTYEYDSNNNIIKVNTYNSENNLIRIQSNKYDNKRHIVEMLLITPGKGISWKYIYNYNVKGEKIKQFRYKPDGNLKDKRTYLYDENGNDILQIKFNPNGSYTKLVSDYDEMNNITVQSWLNEQDEKTNQTSFQYVYNEHKNWITKKRSSNGILNMIWEREIEYYK